MDPREVLERVRQDMEMGNFARAESVLKRIIENSLAPKSAYLLLGTLYARQNRLDDAERTFRLALERDPDDAETYNNLGVIYRTQGHNNRALEMLTRAHELNPRRADICYNLGNFYKQINDLPDAERFYRLAFKLDPSYIMAYNNLGTLLEKTERAEEALDVYKAGLAQDKNNPALLFNLGQSLIKAGQSDYGIKCLEESVKRRPDGVEGLVALAQALESAGKPRDALRNLRHAMDLDADNLDIQITLGRLYASAGKIDEAGKVFKKVLDKDPRNVSAALELEKALENSGQLIAARAELESICKQLPQNMNLRFQLGRLHMEMENWDAAGAEFSEVVKYKAQDPRVLGAYGLYCLKTQNWEKARSVFERLVRIQPKDSGVVSQLGLALEKGGKLVDAERVYLGAMSLNLENLDALSGLARLNELRGDYAKAGEFWQRVLNLNSQNSDALAGLVRVKQRLGQQDLALGFAGKKLDANASGDLDDFKDNLDEYENSVKSYETVGVTEWEKNLKNLARMMGLLPEVTKREESEEAYLADLEILKKDTSSIMDIGGIEPVMMINEVPEFLDISEHPFIETEELLGNPEEDPLKMEAENVGGGKESPGTGEGPFSEMQSRSHKAEELERDGETVLDESDEALAQDDELEAFTPPQNAEPKQAEAKKQESRKPDASPPQQNQPPWPHYPQQPPPIYQQPIVMPQIIPQYIPQVVPQIVPQVLPQASMAPVQYSAPAPQAMMSAPAPQMSYAPPAPFEGRERRRGMKPLNEETQEMWIGEDSPVPSHPEPGVTPQPLMRASSDPEDIVELQEGDEDFERILEEESAKALEIENEQAQAEQIVDVEETVSEGEEGAQELTDLVHYDELDDGLPQVSSENEEAVEEDLAELRPVDKPADAQSDEHWLDSMPDLYFEPLEESPASVEEVSPVSIPELDENYIEIPLFGGDSTVGAKLEEEPAIEDFSFDGSADRRSPKHGRREEDKEEFSDLDLDSPPMEWEPGASIERREGDRVAPDILSELTEPADLSGDFEFELEEPEAQRGDSAAVEREGESILMPVTRVNPDALDDVPLVLEEFDEVMEDEAAELLAEPEQPAGAKKAATPQPIREAEELLWEEEIAQPAPKGLVKPEYQSKKVPPPVRHEIPETVKNDFLDAEELIMREEAEQLYGAASREMPKDKGLAGQKSSEPVSVGAEEKKRPSMLGEAEILKKAQGPDRRKNKDSRQTLDMFNYLNDLMKFLPPSVRADYIDSETRLKLEHVRSKLKGTKGLAANAAREADAPANAAKSSAAESAPARPEETEEEKNQRLEKEKIEKAFSFLKNLVPYHPDREVGLALNHKVSKILHKIRKEQDDKEESE